jgi:hypothetical protein
MHPRQFSVHITTDSSSRQSEAMFRALVTALLQHPLGWANQGYTFNIVPSAAAATHPLITITLTPQHVLDRKFPEFATERLSLCNMATREIYLNEQRWMGVYDDNKSNLSLPAYRAYMVQHEVGHALGFGHTKCKQGGAKCPIMVQQTKGTGGCAPYPFPSSP